MRDIREAHKDKKIFILTTFQYVDLLSRCPFIDGVLIDDFDSKDLNISNYERKVEIIGISNKPKLNQFLTQILR